MSANPLIASSPIQPVTALIGAGGAGTLAVITGVEGPSYRPVGAMMAVLDGDARVGSLSSGCVESDIALHAREAWESRRPLRVRYGQGSPFRDIQLPCGGGLDILLVPRPDVTALAQLEQAHAARRAATLSIDARNGQMRVGPPGPVGWQGDVFTLAVLPEPFFYIFGKGPEASTFAALVNAAGFPNLLLSPDDETLAAGAEAGCATRHLTRAHFPTDLSPDERSAVVLFFHDHEWEPPILGPALGSPAFYVGAQGSQRARLMREAEMAAAGVPEDHIARMRGPIGLVPSARDARTLAVSVLAEVLAGLQRQEPRG